MKRHFFIIVFLICSFSAFAQRNLAVKLDGIDNNLRIGMDTLRHHWTLEAWVKTDPTEWKELEVIVGGGEYAKQNISDHWPLVLRKGHLYNAGADLQAGVLPVGQWVHIAASCNGTYVALFLNGKEVARKDTVTSILPGAIGVDESSETVFGGEIDEVRIWETGLGERELSSWMNRKITSKHPAFNSLKGYYTFDDWADDMSVNWAGKGRQSHHLRNGRVKQYGTVALATAVTSDHPTFQQPLQVQQLFNAVVLSNEWDADQGKQGYQVLKLRITVNGEKKPLVLQELKLDLSACTSLKDMDRVHVYQIGQKPRSQERVELTDSSILPQKQMTFKFPDSKAVTLQPGANYFLITLDVNAQAPLGNRLKGTIPSIRLSGKRYVPESDTSCLDAEITATNAANATKVHQPKVLKVLQWNIWHGGVHLGKDGRERIIELIKETEADIILMQEAYGAQQMIADSLGYYLQTPSSDANLALFSRYPLEKINTKHPFQSNPAKVTLPGGKQICVNDCWLRYAYRPEYTCAYTNQGMNPDQWVAEDSILALEDARYILEKDILPYAEKDTPIIIGGDFNSCSHLDWTSRAASLHYGYAAEKLPTSRYMIEQGFSDSFRELHSDEVKRPEGTFAVILGHLQTARIDFIYYKKENGLKPISSKIVRTTAEIDDVWPSDHAGVLTTFELTK